MILERLFCVKDFCSGLKRTPHCIERSAVQV
jgi:hypothetical protein